ncbi:MAG: ABC transporter ATP-binding protein [Anaerolineae bacterium]
MGAHTAKPKDTRGALRRLWGYLRRQRAGLIASVILMIVTTGLDLAGPYMMGVAVDEFIATKQLDGLVTLLLQMIAIYVVASAAVWWQIYIMAGVAQYVVRDLRKDLFAKLQVLPLSYLDAHPHGDLMSRLTNDVENINAVLSGGFGQMISSVLGMVGVVAVMFFLNVPLTLASMVAVPLTLVATRWLSKRTREGYRAQQKDLGRLNGLIEENVTGQRVVKAYVRENTVMNEFIAANKELRASATRAGIYGGFMGPVMNMVNNLGLAVVAATGAWLAVEGLATVGVIASFLNYARRFTRPVSQLAQLYNQIQSALAGAERIFELLDEEPEMQDAPDAHAISTISGHVQFDDVAFGYVPGVPVLKGVSLEAVRGQMIALVGPTGAGKTTMINLLTRFYEIEGGSVCIDDHDIRTLRKSDLRRKIGLVLQDNFLFADTVLANIRYGRLDATDEEVMEAARFANADHFIRRLPQGYQTVLSERGSNLSQGQRQLLAIARAILADPDILILDEATSNVDTRTEKHLQDALMRLMQGRTSFVIAHRLSTIRDADQVLVINDGQIIERGRHEELLEQKGFYHHLYYSQFHAQAAAAL